MNLSFPVSIVPDKFEPEYSISVNISFSIMKVEKTSSRNLILCRYAKLHTEINEKIEK